MLLTSAALSEQTDSGRSQSGLTASQIIERI